MSAADRDLGEPHDGSATEQLGDGPVLGMDLPNHGKSPRMPVPDLDALARLLLARLDREGIESLHLLGHSMGGGAAIALTTALQSRLRSLTLVAPLGLGPQINGAFIQGILRATRLASLQPWLDTLFGDPAWLSGSFAATAWSEHESAQTRGALAEMPPVCPVPWLCTCCRVSVICRRSRPLACWHNWCASNWPLATPTEDPPA